MRAIATVFPAMFVATTGYAADRTQTVRFAHSASSAALSGTVRNYDITTYVLGASASQVMSVLFAPDNDACAFYVYRPGEGEPAFDGNLMGNEFSGALPATGNYQVRAGLLRGAAAEGQSCNYAITFEISG